MQEQIPSKPQKTGEVRPCFPLTGLQAGMLFHTSSELLTGQDVVQVVCRLEDELEFAEIQRKWNQAVARHDALRLSFEVDAALGPRQSVHEAFEVPVTYHDWQQETSIEYQDRLEKFLEQDRKAPFKLDCPPLFRVALIRIKGPSSVMIWTFHHIILDGRAIPIVLREVLGKGASMLAQEFSPRYRDYLTWFAKQDHEATKPFWRDYLGGVSIPTPLPYCEIYSKNRNKSSHYEIVGKVNLQLDEAQRKMLEGKAADCGVTINTLLQATWGLLLARSTGMSKVCFGTIRSCRYGNVPNASETVGMFTNAVPIAVEVQEDLFVFDWLKKIYANHKTLRFYEHTPQSVIRNSLRLPMLSPLYESMLAVETRDLNAVLDALPSNGKTRSVEVRQQTGIPITVSATITNFITISILYDQSRFNANCMERLIHQFLTALRSIATASPETNISDIEILPDYQVTEQVETFNKTERDTSKDIPLHQMFLNQAKLTPFAIAVKDGSLELTYKQLDEWSARIAKDLRAKGVLPGCPVGLFFDRSCEAVATILGVLRLGTFYVPLPLESPPDRLALMIANSKAELILCNVESQVLLEPLNVKCMVIAALPDEDTDTTFLGDDPEVELDSPLCVIFTSGTTGVPKGVSLSHGGYSNLLWHRTQTRFRSEDFSYSPLTAPWHFDASIVQMFSPIVTGGTLVLYTSVADLGYSEDYHQLTVLTGASSMIGGLLRKHGPPQKAKVIGLGADSVPADLLEVLKTNPNFERLITGYGVTECTCYSTDITLYDRSKNSCKTNLVEVQDLKSIVGFPISNAKVYILDARKRLLPLGATGEIYLGGPGVANGYLGADEVNQSRFGPNPIESESTTLLYQTGDLGRWREDGTLEFLGRKDNQIKLNGYRIELGEIEANISLLPCVRQAIVIVREDIPGERRLVAYCIIHQDSLDCELEIKRQLRKKLPEYMIPNHFLILDEFPFTSNGKIDHSRLPQPGQDYSDKMRLKEPPSNPVEVQLLTIWRELLGKSQIGIRDDFFDIGGDSLTALNLFVRIKNQLGVSLPLSILFSRRNIQQLAHHIESTSASIADKSLKNSPILSIAPLKLEGKGDPLYIMPSLFGELLFARPIIDRIGSQNPIFGVQPSPDSQSSEDDWDFIKVACEYARVIQEHHPSGPVNLLGYSYGGFLAYEVARQLVLQKHSVGLLIVIDTGPENRFKRQGIRSHFRHACAVIKNAPRWMYDQRDTKSLTSLVSKVKRKATFLLRRYWSASDSSLQLGDVADTRKIQVEYLSRSELLFTSFRRYIPDHYSGTVHLYRASTRPLFHSHSSDLGWSRVAYEVRVIDLPGNHETILKDPSVSVLSSHLSHLMLTAPR